MIPKAIPEHFLVGWQSRHQTEFKLSAKKQRSDTMTSIRSLRQTSSLREVFSLQNCLIYMWFLLMDIRITSFSSQYQIWMRWVSDDDSDVISQYTDILNIVNLCGIITGPLLGFLLVDLPRRIVLKRRDDVFLASFISTTFGMYVVTLAACALSFLASIRQPIEIHWLTIFCDFVVRAMLYVVRNVMLIILNKDEYFGRVMGVANAVAIVTGFLMPPFTDLVLGPFGGNFTIFELIFGAINVTQLLVPVYFTFQIKSYYQRNYQWESAFERMPSRKDTLDLKK